MYLRKNNVVASYEFIHETKHNVYLLVISLLICIWIVPFALFEICMLGLRLIFL